MLNGNVSRWTSVAIERIKMNIIPGGIFNDERGTLKFVNDFNFSDVKRFYQIENSSTDIVRAWQGHKIENKYFFVTSGVFLICGVKIDNWKKPSLDLPVKRIILTSEQSQVLLIPAGYANGLKALEEDSKIMIFSSNNLKDAENDNYRFDQNLWYNWNN